MPKKGSIHKVKPKEPLSTVTFRLSSQIRPEVLKMVNESHMKGELSSHINNALNVYEIAVRNGLLPTIYNSDLGININIEANELAVVTKEDYYSPGGPSNNNQENQDIKAEDSSKQILDYEQANVVQFNYDSEDDLFGRKISSSSSAEDEKTKKETSNRSAASRMVQSFAKFHK
jgi:hypothetical protein